MDRKRLERKKKNLHLLSFVDVPTSEKCDVSFLIHQVQLSHRALEEESRPSREQDSDHATRHFLFPFLRLGLTVDMMRISRMNPTSVAQPYAHCAKGLLEGRLLLIGTVSCEARKRPCRVRGRRHSACEHSRIKKRVVSLSSSNLFTPMSLGARKTRDIRLTRVCASRPPAPSLFRQCFLRDLLLHCLCDLSPRQISGGRGVSLAENGYSL